MRPTLPVLRQMQMEVTPCLSDGQKFNRMLASPTEGAKGEVHFHMQLVKERTDTALWVSNVAKNLF